MIEKKVFDYKLEMQNCFSLNKGEVLPEFTTDSLYDAVYSIALKIQSKKVDFVCLESDFLRFGRTVTKAIKDAEAEVNTLLIEDDEFYHAHLKSFFSFSSSEVIVMGTTHLLALTAYYATMQKTSCHAVVTEPNFENVLSSRMPVLLNGVPLTVEVTPFKTVVCDIEIINKASRQSLAESYIRTVSKLITLIDYKLRVYTDGVSFDKNNYGEIKNAIQKVILINNYQNPKEVLTYAQAVIAKINATTDILKEGAVELFCDTLGVFNPDLSYGDRLITAFSKLVKIYHMFWNNNFSDLVSVPDYNADIFLLEKSTGKNGSYFRKKLKIPSERRRTLINALISKTKDGFLKETASLLSVLYSVEKIYAGLNKTPKDKPNIKYDIIKNSLTLCTYFSDKTSILTLLRDMGILRCMQ